MYHTQERREKRLSKPILCQKNNAWLGVAYYFWNDEIDAIQWGNTSKNQTGYFEIYKAIIDSENIIDTVFNEEHYNFWLKQIEKAAKHISKKSGMKASLKEINQYFKNKAKWSDLTDGILFQDLPNSEDLLVRNLYYRKRIQMAVYKLEIINNFAFHSETGCS